jgi:hypothetical protein
MTLSLRNLVTNGVPFIIGGLAFLVIVGPRVLAPTNIVWLGGGDPAAHYLGWLFFRNSAWTLPIGLNPAYGLEISNAIIFSDSNPLLAFVFKFLAPVLSEPFQYFGIWLLACFVLQAWFGWKLVGLVAESKAIQAISAALFVFAPPFIWRLHGHLNLVAHFLVLAALYLVLSRAEKRRWAAWAVLMVVSSLVHAYLLAMVALLWIADLTQDALRRKVAGRQFILELSVVMAVTGLACWQAGYFSVGAGTTEGGYGYYRTNLLSLVDPSGWSYVIKDIPEGGGDYEGFNFLGLGIIFLAICALSAALAGNTGVRVAIRKYPMLLAALAGLAAFAVSNNVGLGSLQHGFPLPPPILGAASFFRASGRMFWPVFYVIVLIVIFLVVRGYSKRTAVYLLACAAVIQVADTSAAWAPIRMRLMTEPKPVLATPLTGPFWEHAAVRYRTVRYIPPGTYWPDWYKVAAYAAQNGLSTDAVHLARISRVALQQARQNAAEHVATGRYEAGTLYILDDNTARLAALSIDSGSDLLLKADGLNVLAPGWKRCVHCPPIAQEVGSEDFLRHLKVGERVLTNLAGAGLPYLADGWSSPEEWGIWSDGASAQLVLPVSGKVKSITVEARALVTPAHPKQDVAVKINGALVLTTSLATAGDNLLQIPVPRDMQEESAGRGVMRVRFEFPNAVEPKHIGLNDDSRKLALGLQAITLH